MSCPPVIRSFGLIVQVKLAGPLAVNAPPDRASAIGVLRAAVTAGIDHIDTAQYYGPDVVNDLIREALYPYPGDLAIVSKVGVFRDAGAGNPHDDARQLRAGIEDNLRSLRVDQLAAVNLRLPSPGRADARFDDQLAAMVQARDEGLIAGVGLSNVSLEQLRHAADGTEIVCVQNLFHLADRGSTPVLAESARLGVTPPQVALQWLLQLAPSVLLIPGTGSTGHLRENLAAEHVALDDEAVRELA